MTKYDTIGYTAKTPKWAIAYKFPPEEVVTKLKHLDALSFIDKNRLFHKYLVDGIHPNELGKKKLGKFYASEVLNYFSYL